MADRTVAYFSMEIALEAAIPTYAGGLGVLAGDTIRAAADLKVPIVAVSLVHRKGYFYQQVDASGWQHEEPAEWELEDFLQAMPARTSVTIEGRTVHLRAWKYEVAGKSGYSVPVYLLDADLTENSEWDRTLTHWLYGGDQHYRLCQEVVLGAGGVRMLRTLGYEDLRQFHMNEGHASLLSRTARRACPSCRTDRTGSRRCRSRTPPVHFYNAHAGSRRSRSVPDGLIDAAFDPKSNTFVPLRWTQSD